MPDYVLEFVDTRRTFGKHGKKVFVVHGTVQAFEHSADLGDYSGVRVYASALVDAFERGFQHRTVFHRKTIVPSLYDQRVFLHAHFTEGDEHCKFEKHFTFRREPGFDLDRVVHPCAFVFRRPVDVEGLALRREGEWT